ncbi:hypothetical protein ACLBOM_20770 [Escherichia coli]
MVVTGKPVSLIAALILLIVDQQFAVDLKTIETHLFDITKNLQNIFRKNA